jgi:hypothetical protein
VDQLSNATLACHGGLNVNLMRSNMLLCISHISSCNAGWNGSGGHNALI